MYSQLPLNLGRAGSDKYSTPSTDSVKGDKRINGTLVHVSGRLLTESEKAGGQWYEVDLTTRDTHDERTSSSHALSRARAARGSIQRVAPSHPIAHASRSKLSSTLFGDSRISRIERDGGTVADDKRRRARRKIGMKRLKEMFYFLVGLARGQAIGYNGPGGRAGSCIHNFNHYGVIMMRWPAGPLGKYVIPSE
ncbi:hypothetical protein B0H11DRAFT_1921783 [Mycena galericulata]|nr:hypothetical protein B0H11DRAFT_1921783 [Mycena galericulata]